MTDKLATGFGFLAKLIGAKIESVSFAVHVMSDDDVSPYLQELGLTTDHTGRTFIDCAADGETIRFRPEGRVLVDMDDWGRVESRASFEGIEEALPPGSVIAGIDAIVQDNILLVGFELHIDNSSRLLVLNCGDDLAIGVNSDHPILHEPGVVRQGVPRSG